MNYNDKKNRIWEAYLNLNGETIKSTEKKYTSWHFGNSEKMANKLTELVGNLLKICLLYVKNSNWFIELINVAFFEIFKLGQTHSR